MSGTATGGINRALSGLLTPLLLKTPLTPNQVTFLSMAAGLACGALFSLGGTFGPLAGSAFFTLAAVLDNCDGEIARAKNLRSDRGGRLDVIADLVVDLAFFAGLTADRMKHHDRRTALFFGTAAAIGVLANFTVVLLEKKRGFGPAVYGQPRPKNVLRGTAARVADAVREGDSTWLVVAFAAAGQSGALLAAGAVYVHVLWVSALVTNYRWLAASK